MDKRKQDDPCTEKQSNDEDDYSGSTSDSEEDSINSSDEVVKELNVDFEACPMLEQDSAGIKRLLAQLFLKDNVNLNQLTETLMNQKDIGAIIRQINQEEDDDSEPEENEEDDVLGLISFLNLSDPVNQSKEWFGQLMEYFTKHLTGDKKSEIDAILKGESKKVWIINERFINLGWQLAVPSYSQISSELKSSQIDFNHYLLVCKILYPKRRYKKEKKSKLEKDDVVFLNPEEELFDECADYRYEFDVSKQCDSDTMGGEWDEGDQEYLPCRRVLIFSPQSWTKANDNLKRHSANPISTN